MGEEAPDEVWYGVAELCCGTAWVFSWREASSLHGRTFAAWVEPGHQNHVQLEVGFSRQGCRAGCAGSSWLILVSLEGSGCKRRGVV